jgi:NitT/TauT family transport system substrate-binding protein
MYRMVTRALIGTLALALLVAGCGQPVPATTGAGRGGAAATAPGPQSRPLRSIKLDIPFRHAPYAWYFVAADKGYYAEEGLEVEFVTAGNGPAAVLAGEMPFSTSASASLSAILKGGPMKIVLTNMDRPGLELWSSTPDIQTLQDLQGRIVGVGSRGDTMEVSTRMALAKAGLDPDGVAYTALGPGGTSLAALQSGSVPAAVLGIGDTQKLRLAGPKGHRIVDYASEIRMQFNGLVASDRVIREDPELVEGFLRATSKGREYVRLHKEGTLEVLARYNDAPREVNEPDYDVVITAMTADGTLPEEVQRLDAATRAAVIGAPAARPLDEIYDYSVARNVYDQLRSGAWRPER